MFQGHFVSVFFLVFVAAAVWDLFFSRNPSAFHSRGVVAFLQHQLLKGLQGCHSKNMLSRRFRDDPRDERTASHDQFWIESVRSFTFEAVHGKLPRSIE